MPTVFSSIHRECSFTTPQFDGSGTRLYARASRSIVLDLQRHPFFDHRAFTDLHMSAYYDLDLSPGALVPHNAPWRPVRYRGFSSEVGVPQYFTISGFTGCARMLCTPHHRGFRLVHVDPAFETDDDGDADDDHRRDSTPRSYRQRPGLRDTGTEGLSAVFHARMLQPPLPCTPPALPTVAVVRDLHERAVLGCTASPRSPTIASYGLDGVVRFSSIQP